MDFENGRMRKISRGFIQSRENIRMLTRLTIRFTDIHAWIVASSFQRRPRNRRKILRIHQMATRTEYQDSRSDRFRTTAPSTYPHGRR